LERHRAADGSSLSIVRWIARAWSLATIALVLAFIAGEGIDLSGAGQYVGFLFFPVGICAGLIVAWWREKAGAIITIGSLLIFYAIHLATAGTLPRGPAWVLFAAPGFLFLLTSMLSRRNTS
jgi:hypothetical protein